MASKCDKCLPPVLPDLFSVFVYMPMMEPRMERAGEMILRFSTVLLFLANSARPQGTAG